ncbi:MAG TPA: MraY family glycosyltransferase [Candidatus Binatia bacterium]|nr:MraY family glycosyltransferase [Candidatus Binatia bacterium]
MIAALAAFVVSALVALYTTPLMRRAAIEFGIVDEPDGLLKTHTEPVPYLGGLAVFLAFLITLAVVFEFSHAVLGILLSGTLMLLVGLIDDLGVLSPLEKLAGQSIAVAVLIKAGLFIKLVFIPPLAAFALSVLWLLTVTNAFNIMDVMDGLASGVAVIAAVFLAGIAVRNGEPMVAVMAASLAGSLAGFLRYNSSPARIYLGDSGSLFVGLTLSALAMNGGYTTKNSLGMLTPVIILGVPLFDLAFVALVRLEKGLSPFRGSPDHFALRLKRTGRSVTHTVSTVYLAGLLLGLSGIAVMEAPDERSAALIVAGIAAVLLVVAGVLRQIGD